MNNQTMTANMKNSTGKLVVYKRAYEASEDGKFYEEKGDISLNSFKEMQAIVLLDGGTYNGHKAINNNTNAEELTKTTEILDVEDKFRACRKVKRGNISPPSPHIVTYPNKNIQKLKIDLNFIYSDTSEVDIVNYSSDDDNQNPLYIEDVKGKANKGKANKGKANKAGDNRQINESMNKKTKASLNTCAD